MAGYRPLVVQSGSMAPAIRTGDALFSRVVHPAAVGVGDVVTFVDDTRGGRLVTHRVVEVRHDDERYSFVTKGDRSLGVERWDVDDGATIGRTALRVPMLGFAVAATSSAPWRALCAALVMCLTTVPMIRRIWS
jgi:signal peptidase